MAKATPKSQKRPSPKDLSAKPKEVSRSEAKQVKGGWRRNQTLTINGTT